MDHDYDLADFDYIFIIALHTPSKSCCNAGAGKNPILQSLQTGPNDPTEVTLIFWCVSLVQEQQSCSLRSLTMMMKNGIICI